MNWFFCVILTLFSVSCFAQPLTVSNNGHFLLRGGKPFFWLGDTGWEAFHVLNQQEAKMYVDDRANKGFNVLQMVAISELGGDTIPNAYGDLPIDPGTKQPLVTDGNDFGNPSEYDYWDHIEYVVSIAKERNMLVALLPCWGEYVTNRFRNKPLFETEAEAYNYGWFIGNRFKPLNDHIVWVLGGDRLPNERIHGVLRWNSMAEGINDAIAGENRMNQQSDFSKTTMTFHCYASSSQWFHNEPWIDFHTWGSYHEKQNNERAYDLAWRDWVLTNPKPTINSEPAYEAGSINYDVQGKFGHFDEFDVRQVAYWSVFSGAAGHTIGVTKIWRFSGAGTSGDGSWTSQLALPAAAQMKHLKNLMLSRPFEERIPSDLITPDNPYDPVGRLQGTHGQNYGFVYIPTGKPVIVDASQIQGQKVLAWWFNPRTGEAIKIGVFNNTGLLPFDAPGATQRGNDWVLVLDNADTAFPVPGQISNSETR